MLLIEMKCVLDCAGDCGCGLLIRAHLLVGGEGLVGGPGKKKQRFLQVFF